MGRLAALVATAVTVVYLLLLPHRIDSLRFVSPEPAPTGDEPYYLEMTLSLLRYGTLELSQVHDVDAAYHVFYPAPLLPHDAASPRGHVSKHYPGLAVLILPAYWLGEILGHGQYGGERFAVAVLLGIIGGLVVANCFLLAHEAGGGTRWSLAAAALIGLTSPVLSYSFLIFPELPAALLVIYAFRRGRLPAGPWRALVAGLALAALPWLHPRLAVLSVTLALWFWLRLRRPWSLLLPFGVPLVLSALGVAAYDVWAFGSPLPNASDHAGFGGPLAAVIGGIGLLLDQQWGLLIFGPGLLISAAGIVPLLRRNWRDLAGLALVILPYLLLIAAYRQWWGEWGPPARYLTPVVPLLALPLGLARPSGWVSQSLAALLAAGSLVVSVLFVVWPATMYNQPDGRGALWLKIAELGGPDLSKFLPAIVAPNGLTPVLTALWCMVLGATVSLLVLSPYFEAGAGTVTGQPPRVTTSNEQIAR